MPSRSGNFDYRQTVIGDCGHVCPAWPQFHTLGAPSSDIEVLCPECVRIRYRMPAFKVDPEDMIYVKIHREEKPEPKPVKKATKKKAAVRCSICQQKGHRYESCPLLVGQGTLFDA